MLNKKLAWLLVILGILTSGCSLASVLLPPTPTLYVTPTPTTTPAPLPDLIISGVEELDLYPDPCNLSSTRFALRVTVKNQGEGSAGPFVVEMNGLRRSMPGNLAPQQQAVLSFSGLHEHIAIRVDSNDQVMETDETNNVRVAYLAAPTAPANCFITPTPAVNTISALFTFQGHKASVTTVAFTPDSSLVVSGSLDNSIRFWRIQEADLLRTMTGNPSPILAMAVSPGGYNLAAGSSDGKIRLWQVNNGQLIQTLGAHGRRVTCLAFSPNGQYLASGGDDYTVRVFSLINARLVEIIDEAMGVVNSLAYSPDGLRLAWIEDNGYLRIRSQQDNTWQYNQQISPVPALSLAFSPNSAWLAVGASDGSLWVVRVQDDEIVYQAQPHRLALNHLAFSPDGNWLATASADATIKLWQVDQNAAGAASPGLPEFQMKLVRLLAGHNGAVNWVEFSPGSNLLASGADDQTVRLWAVPNR